MKKIKLHLAASYFSAVLLRGRVIRRRTMDSTPRDRSSILPIEFFFLSKFATEILSVAVVEETYTFMEICWSEISRDLEISYKFQVETWSRMS